MWDFFEMFDFKAISGDRAVFLKNKTDIVLSESTAHKYFRDEDPIGKNIELTMYNDSKLVTVVGLLNPADTLKYE